VRDSLPFARRAGPAAIPVCRNRKLSAGLPESITDLSGHWSIAISYARRAMDYFE